MTIRFYLTFIFLYALFSTKTSAQYLHPDSLFALGEYKLASLEYERLISGSTESSSLNEWRFKRARCFKLLNEYSRAQVELSKISYWTLPDSVSVRYHYESALCDYLAGSFTNAIFQTEQISASAILTDEVKAQVTLIRMLSFNETMEWEKAKVEALIYIRLVYPQSLGDSIENVLKTCYQPKNLPRIKSHKKATIYRMLPGLGQAYAGKPVEGAFNFSLNLAFLSFGAYQVIKGYYITGYFVGTIGLNKFYFGGHARTDFLLEKHNYEQRKRFCEKVKLIVLNENKKAGLTGF